MKFFKQLILSTLIIIIFFACDIFNPSVEQDSYYPLQVGNEWHYYNYGANSFDSDSLIVKIESKVRINNITYFVLNAYNSSNDEPISSSNLREDNGVVYVYGDSLEHVAIDFTRNVGNLYYRQDSSYSSTIISKTDSVNTSMGIIYDCISISSTSPLFTTLSRYLPNVGKIYSHSEFRMGCSIDIVTYLVWANINGYKIIIE